MPKSGKGKGRKAGSQRQLGTPGLSNAPLKYKTPEPEQRQLATPDVTLVATSKAPKSAIQVLGKAKQTRIEEEVEVTGWCRSEDVDEDEPSYGPWIAKGNPAGFLDSEDEELIDEMGRESEETMRNQLSKDDWRSVGEFLLSALSTALGLFNKEEEQYVLEEVLGLNDDDDHSGREGLSNRLEEYHDERDSLNEELDRFEEEAEELKRKKEQLEELFAARQEIGTKEETGFWKKKAEQLEEELFLEKQKTQRLPYVERDLKKLDAFIANFAGCSVGRPADTLLAAARGKLEKMSRSKECLRIKELEEEAKMYRNHIDLVDAELRELSGSVTGKVELTDEGVQVSLEVEDASTQSISMEVEEVGGTGRSELEQAMERKRKRKGSKKEEERKGKGKEDTEMLDEGRYNLFEDLSEYERSWTRPR